MLTVTGRPVQGISLEVAEEAVCEVLNELAVQPVGEYELEKVKNKFESTHIFGNINYLNVATNLAQFELLGGAERIDVEVDNYRSVTADHLQKVAKEMFCQENSSILYYKAVK